MLRRTHPHKVTWFLTVDVFAFFREALMAGHTGVDLTGERRTSLIIALAVTGPVFLSGLLPAEEVPLKGRLRSVVDNF